MRSTYTSRNNASRWATVVVFLAIVSCNSSEEPEIDQTPPSVPVITLLRATSPDGSGVVVVSGAAGSVEAGALVQVRESEGTTPASGQGTAAGDGSFAVSIISERLQLLEVVAVDASNNASLAAVITVGAPFTLEQQGAAAQDVTAGEAPASPITALVRDESGLPAAGVQVRFRALAASPAPSQLLTDDNGLAVWPIEAPTSAGNLQLEAVLDDPLLAAAVTWDLTIKAAAAATLLVQSGSEQIAAPLTALKQAMVLRIADAYGNPIAGAAVAWQTVSGALSQPATQTATDGQASAIWSMPSMDGEYELTATSLVLPGQEARFVGVAGGPPVVASYNPDPAIPGMSLTLDGSGFSRAAEFNEVLFPSNEGMVAGEILTTSPTQMVVAVPSGSVSGDLLVRVSERDAAPTVLRIESALGVPVAVSIGVGSTRLETPNGDEQYVLAVYSGSTSSGFFTVGSDPLAAKRRIVEDTSAPQRGESGGLHPWLRRQEHLTRSLPVARASAVAHKPLQEGSFTVLASLSGNAYEQVTATLRYQGSRARIYVDNRVLTSELTDADVASMGAAFDASGGSYWTVRNNFGAESDVDADGAVTILLTPTVNGLTPPGSGSFVGGFFFSQDLHVVANSNNMEILYGMVPDPTGRWGNVFPKSSTLDVLASVLPHEQQHLVSYNNHVLVRSGDPEELWLNEALSHVAEDLSGFPDQNILRANRFLDAPQLVSMTTGGNALEERGMSFLFVRYLADYQDSGFFGRVVQTSNVGVSNIASATGREYLDWMGDWAATLYLDQQGLSAAPYLYTSINLSGDFNPPQLTSLSLGAPSATGTLPVAGVRFFLLSGTTDPSTDLQVSGDVQAIVMRVR